MKNKGSIYQQNFDTYLELIKDIRLDSLAHRLGAKFEKEKIHIQFFNHQYYVSAEGISNPSGQKPSYDICVILCKYILLCPDSPPSDHEWVSYRNFKNSAPLINYFKNEVEEAIASLFSQKLTTLQQAGDLLAGYQPSLKVDYDFMIQFDALPLIPVLLLYNDSDEEFKATCSIMFEAQAETYLDCECLAMLGRQFFLHLKSAL